MNAFLIIIGEYKWKQTGEVSVKMT